MKYLQTYERWLEPKYLSDEQLDALIAKYNPDFKWSDKAIWRGDHMADEDIYLTDSDIKPRKSANTSNYYTYLWDNSPYLGDFPKRSMSVICSTEKYGAEDYGNLYRVIPFSDAKISMAPASDFWASFKMIQKQFDTNYESLDTFNEILKKSYKILTKGKYLSDDSKKIFFKSMEELIKKLNVSDVKLEEMYDGYEQDKRFSIMPFDVILQMPKTLDEYYKLLDPYANGFQLLDYVEYVETEEEDAEVFIEGGHILVTLERNRKE